MRIAVAGYMVRHPVAGNVMALFQYLLGLHRLGHEVIYIEESGWPNACYDPSARKYSDDPRSGLAVAHELMARCGVAFPICYADFQTGRLSGLQWHDVKRMLRAADLLLNIGGVCWLPEFRLCRRRACYCKNTSLLVRRTTK